MILIRLLGVFYLIFRVWLTESKLKEDLGYQRRYMSRNLNIYLALAWISNFQAQIFSFIVLVALPVMIASFITTDIRFFSRYRKGTHFMKETPKEHHIWLLWERITLHIPLIIMGFWFYVGGLKNYFTRQSLLEVALTGTILMYSTWFGFDKRAQNKKFIPYFRDVMTTAVTLSITGNIIYMLQVL